MKVGLFSQRKNISAIQVWPVWLLYYSIHVGLPRKLFFSRPNLTQVFISVYFLNMGYKQGQEIFRCEPFSYIVNNNSIPSVCDFCLTSKIGGQNNSMKKCSKCKVVYYCNIQCQKNAWFTHHRGECSYLTMGGFL